ncbi:MAG TPA: BrnT family toxin [Desulfuromonadales bacterium]|nr:BrnT family toxin [Desulfuromonadales bacterium]
MIFEWDNYKSKVNLKNHKVSFEEARSVFADSLSITVADTDHSEGEYRFIDIGMSEQRRLLVVSYTERGRSIRIISARCALPVERRLYEKEN